MSSTIGEEASDSIDRNLSGLTASAVEAQTSRWPGLYESFTVTQLEHAVDDTRYHFQFLSAALWADEHILYDEYVEWTRELFVHLGLASEWLDGSLTDVRDTVIGALPQDHARAAAAIIDSALSADAHFHSDSKELVDLERPYGGLAASYLSAILDGDLPRATRTLADELDSGTSIWDIYLRVIQPAQLELGRLWHLARITVGQEHGASEVTRRAMAQLMSDLHPEAVDGPTVVTACVDSEDHSIGMQMVSDFFTLDGWDVRYFGATTPALSIVSEAQRHGADLVALSATMSHRIKDVAAVVSALRSNEATAQIPVLVGGHPFNIAENLWLRVGADGCASDAEAALRVGRELVAARSGGHARGDHDPV